MFGTDPVYFAFATNAYAMIRDPDLFKTNDPTGQVRHWLEMCTFPGGGNSRANWTKEITSYLPCTPGAGSGKHRYIFLLCQQSIGSSGASRIEQAFIHSPNEDLKDRMGFYVDKYMREKGLEVVAATFMLVSRFFKCGEGREREREMADSSRCCGT